jgi:hypothetical protein
LRGGDLSLTNIRHAVKRLRDRESGEITLVYIKASATLRRLPTSLSIQSYGKRRISATESSLAVVPDLARDLVVNSVPFPSASDIASTDNVRKKVFYFERASIN